MAFTLLGNAMHPAYGHPKMLARAYDQVYYEGREMGNLPLRGRKTVEQSAAVYRVEYAQIVHSFSTLTRIDSEKFVRPLPTSLVHLEMVFPSKKYKAYCLKASESGPVVQYEPTSDYMMDGLQPRIDLRPGTEITVYPEDNVDADPQFNEYPPNEESAWRGQNRLPAGSLRRYVLRSTVVIPVTQVLTPRRPEPFRQYRSPPTRKRVERSPQHQPGRIHARWNLLPFRV